MIVVSTVQALRDALDGVGPRPVSFGFVPTMGGLHAGHQALIQASLRQCHTTVVSLFVNRAQFAPCEDFASYPRTMDADLSICKECGVDIVFAPHEADVYPSDFDTAVETGVGSAQRNPASEGAARPTFFKGVATILTKLFILIRPTAVFFGQKDAQQCAVVRRLVRDLWFNTEVVVCDTVRESDGLAMSTRNGYLLPLERQHASVLYKSLLHGLEIARQGIRDANQLRNAIRTYIDQWEQLSKPSAVEFRLVYVSVCCSGTFKELDGNVPVDVDCIACIAAMMGKARLIDNIRLQFEEERNLEPSKP
jgi:pantoate--beta-alanine ligase